MTGKMVKALTSRSVDATFSAVGGAMRSIAARGVSLIAGKEKYGWDIGLDGMAHRMLDDSPATLIGMLGTNEIVYACMRERMKFLIQPAFKVERKQADGTYVDEPDHDMAALFRRPGPNMDAPTLWRCLEASYASIGRLYLDPMYRGSRLAGLNPLNPVYMHERYSEGILTGYDWMPPDAPTVHYAPDQLIVRRAVDWADVPPMIAALGAVEADEVSGAFLRTFFSNGGVPSGIVKIREAWDETKATAFRNEWMKRFGPLSTTPGAPALLFPPVESYERIGVSVSEVDSQTVKTLLETRICMCFGISPLIIYSYAGLLRAIESNLQEAWESTWDATALPLLREWAEWINWAILTQYESEDDVLLGNVRCRFDPAGLGPYQEDVDAKATLYLAGYEAGTVKLNEYRAVLGLPREADGDVYKADRANEQAALLELPARQEVEP